METLHVVEAGVKTSEEFDPRVRSCTAIDLNKRFKSIAEIATSLGQAIDENELADLADLTTSIDLAISSAAIEDDSAAVTIKLKETEKETIEA